MADGNDMELVPMHVLETAWCEADRDFEREHTTPYLWDQPQRFHLANVTWETGLDYSMSHRFPVDYPEDYLFVETVYRELHVRTCWSFSTIACSTYRRQR